MNNIFKGSTLVITGGTGSFGKQVLKRFLDSDVSEIRVLSRDEKKQEDLRLELNDPKVRFYIGDVRDRSSLRSVFKSVDYVFHAAALKQVPSCEFYPIEAVKTNVLGTENVLNLSADNGVRRVIVLSTDKAVYPINAMGMSKALAEKVMMANARQQGSGETVFCATRYGNVMGSRGSVIPLFISQMQSGSPISITDPKMTRFLMTLEDSVDLVLYAFENGEQGDIFVKKSPASTIEDLMIALQELLGVEGGEVSVIGTRHGEKLYESLISREEMCVAEDRGGYFRIPMDNRDLNYAKYFSEGSSIISSVVDYTSHNTDRLNVGQIKALLMKLQSIKEVLDA